MSSYIFDEASRIFLRPEYGKFSYNDGDAEEERLAKIIAEAKDKSVLSRELPQSVVDWPTFYHLSELRSNLLRPFEDRLRASSVLELGGGCGAITRYLGEVSKQVTMVEGSPRRAAIAADRCLGLPAVSIYCDTIQNADLPKASFDVVTLIGVLEYSRMFDKENADPVGNILETARSFLAPGGILILALENQLGLKYYAGAPEDHVGQEMFGISDVYKEGGVVTFGVAEMKNRLAQAGYTRIEQYMPLPDYKLPSMVVCPAAKELGADKFNLHALLSDSLSEERRPKHRYLFSMENNWGVLVRNGLAWEFANSLFFTAQNAECPAPAEQPRERSLLAVRYSTNRQPGFMKKTEIVREGEDTFVYRSPLVPDAPKPLTLLKNTYPEKERYYPYPKFSDGLLKIVNRRNWTAAEVTAWFKPLADFLEEKAEPGEGGAKEISTGYMDCIARNVLISPSGELTYFDLEWSFGGSKMPFAHLLFYNLICSLDGLHEVEAPQPGTPVVIWRLALAVMSELGLPLSAEDEEAFLHWVMRFHAQALGIPSAGDYSNAWLWLRKSSRELMTLLAEKNASLEEAQQKVNALAVENAALRKVLEKMKSREG